MQGQIRGMKAMEWSLPPLMLNRALRRGICRVGKCGSVSFDAAQTGNTKGRRRLSVARRMNV